MQKEHIGPTATLAAAILARVKPIDGQLSNEVIASAFEAAHQALLLGIHRVEDEERRHAQQVDAQLRG